MFEFGFFAKYTNINKFFLRQVWAICINHSISFIVIGYEYPHQLWGWNIWNIEVMHSYSLEKQKPFATSVFGSPSHFFFFEKPLVNFKLKHLICKPYSKPARDLWRKSSKVGLLSLSEEDSSAISMWTRTFSRVDAERPFEFDHEIYALEMYSTMKL